MDLGEVTNEITHIPPRTVGNDRIEPIPPSSVSEDLSFVLERCDMPSNFHDLLLRSTASCSTIYCKMQ
jgi:hypothetical protein